jgi:enoyl-CoA hydratase/carnithine racemase
LSPAVLSLGRRAVLLQRDMPFEQKLAFLRDQLTLNLQLEDAAEGVSAFLEKRDPQWKGR